MVSLKHLFVTAKADGANTTLVKPSNWNEEHKFETVSDAVFLGRTVGAGPGAVQELPISAVFSTGMVSAYAGATPPIGWFLCDGASLLRADSAALFAVIGTTYGPGSNPGSTFALPDLRGRTVAGIDAGANRLPGWVAGTTGGSSTTSTGSFNMSALNAINFGNVDFVQTSGLIAGANLFSVTTDGGSAAAQLYDPVTISGYTTINSNFTISVSGTSSAFTIVQPTIALNYIIKA